MPLTGGAWPRYVFGLPLAGRCLLAAAGPDRAEGSGQPVRFDAVRRVEVVSVGEDFEGEVGEDSPEALGLIAELVRVAQTAQREVDGTVEGGQGGAIEVVR